MSMGLIDLNRPDKPEYVRELFYKLFPDIGIDVSGYDMKYAWLPNFLLCYTVKIFNDNVFRLFDYKNILENIELIKEYPYDNWEHKIEYECPFEGEPVNEYYESVVKKINTIYDISKKYIFDWINNHKEDIKANIISEKISVEIINSNFSKERLFNYLKAALDVEYITRICNDYSNEDSWKRFDKEVDNFYSNDLLGNVILAMMCEEHINHINYNIYNAYIYVSQLLAEIHEKLYYYILNEVRNVLCDNIESELKLLDLNRSQQQSPAQPVLPQQLVSYDDAYVQQIMNNMMQQPFVAPTSIESNIYMTEDCPVNVQSTQQAKDTLEDNPMFNPSKYGLSDPINKFNVLSIDELQSRIDNENQSAATDEQNTQNDALEIEPDSISSYNALDTYNKAMTCLFAQIILKYKNGVV